MKVSIIGFIFLFLWNSCIPDVSPTPTLPSDPTLDIRGWMTFADGVPHVVLSLCEIKYNDEGYRFCVYDPHEMWERGLRVYPEEGTGYFEFHNVVPGEWALVMDLVTHAIIPNYPNSDDPIVFTVNDKVVELVLHYDEDFPFVVDPPIDPPYPIPSLPPYP